MVHRELLGKFGGAKRWGDGITDIILASGDVYKGEKRIITASGEYKPVVVDFSEKDCARRLEEIREEVKQGIFDHLLELVFLPLYGNETGQRRYELVEQLIRLETELFRAELISSRLIAATLIMSNKLIDKERLNQLWEEIKMFDIIEIARKKGIEEGKGQGMKEMLLDVPIERFGFIPARISEKIQTVDNQL